MNTQLMSELFGGSARYRALRLLFEHPDRGFGARELASSAGIDPGAASRWLRRWADVGLLQRREQGRQTVYMASAASSLVPLRQLMQQDSQVARVLSASLEALDLPVQAAAVFGSIPRGDEHPESDIDLLLVTDGSRLKAQAHFKAAGRELGRPVNVLTMTPQEWAVSIRDGDEVTAQILNNPLIVLKGELGAAQT